MSAFLTEAQLASDILQIDVEKAARLRHKHKWPHVRLGRFDIRYTPAQVEQIAALMTVKAKAPAAEPRAIKGQTAASARRAS